MEGVLVCERMSDVLFYSTFLFCFREMIPTVENGLKISTCFGHT